MLTVEIEKYLDERDINFLAVAASAKQIVIECLRNVSAGEESLSPGKLAELRAKFIVESIEDVPVIQQAYQRVTQSWLRNHQHGAAAERQAGSDVFARSPAAASTWGGCVNGQKISA